MTAEQIRNTTLFGDTLEILPLLPANVIDLAVIDPPYNLTIDYHGNSFRKRDADDYAAWFNEWFLLLLPTLKETASLYICADWLTSTIIYNIISKHTIVRNRITWEREKGRAASKNWKSASEDIWFATLSNRYTFNADDIKLRRKVLAPYRTADGKPKDWKRSTDGNYRDTSASNLMTDITVPFWSMSENTEHPTQKPEKLIAKLILASSNKGDTVFDPFAGSGTTLVTAKKLGRNFVGIESNKKYCLLAEKRLELADKDTAIQGYEDGIFWERNSVPPKK